MHHRRNRTSRKEVKRMGHKEARAAEHEALRGRRPKVVRGAHWNGGMPQPTLVEGRAGKPRRKRAKPKPTVQCPKNPHGRKHEFLTDIERYVKKGFVYTGWRGRRWFSEWHRYSWWSDIPLPRREKPTDINLERKIKLCVHCGFEIVQYKDKIVD